MVRDFLYDLSQHEVANRLFFENSLFFIAFFIFLFSLFVCIIIYNSGGDLFRFYRNHFLTKVDHGLRDILIMMEPSQVLSMTLVLASVVGPICFFIFNIWVATIFVLLVLIAPPIALRYLKHKRSKKFVEQLPDTLSAMVSALRSGLNIVKTFQQIVRNQPNPVAQEFAQILVEYRVGNDLNDSLNNLAIRIGRSEVVLMNSAIKISRAVGGNLSDTLEVLSNSLREKSRVEGKVRALTSMGKAQSRLATFFPLVMAFVFYKFEPESMQLLFTSTLGHIWISIMTLMAIFGSYFINKVVSIDI